MVIDAQTIGALLIFAAIVVGVMLVPVLLDRYFWGNR